MFDRLLTILNQTVSRPLTARPNLNRGAHLARPLRPGASESVVEVPGRVEDLVPGEGIAVTLDVEDLDREDDPCDEAISPCVLGLLRAEIKFGTGGVTLETTCDWLRGTVIVIPCENLRVTAFYDVASLEVPAAGEEEAPVDCSSLPDVRLRATLNYAGVRGHASNAGRLTKTAVARAGVRARVRIPDFAISFTVIPLGSSPQTIDVDVFGASSLCAARYQIVSPLSNVGQHDAESAFPIFNGARFLELANEDPNLPTRALVVFGLAF
jgi:hypothetical protein